MRFFYKQLMVFLLGIMVIGCIGIPSVNSFTGDSWREEIMLHDGGTILIQRSQSYKGFHAIDQSPPVSEQTVKFTVPSTGKSFSWTSEYGEELGRTNFRLLAIHVLNGIPYIVAEPNLCLSYNKWGRPNPPYIFFKNDGDGWKQIPITELPKEFSTLNVLINPSEVNRKGLDVISVKDIQKRNQKLQKPEYKTLLKAPMKYIGCEVLIYYKGAWVGPGDSIGKRMQDRDDGSYEKGNEK